MSRVRFVVRGRNPMFMPAWLVQFTTIEAACHRTTFSFHSRHPGWSISFSSANVEQIITARLHPGVSQCCVIQTFTYIWLTKTNCLFSVTSISLQQRNDDFLFFVRKKRRLSFFEAYWLRMNFVGELFSWNGPHLWIPSQVWKDVDK